MGDRYLTDSIVNDQKYYMFDYDYISKENAVHFKTFKYKGGTDSISYSFIWGPIAERAVNVFPMTTAPNTITLLSLIILSFTHVIFLYTGVDIPESMSEGAAMTSQLVSIDPLPNSLKLCLMAAALLVYQTLDNVDGKQARRTSNISLYRESSSPIGMLFDHGTDSLASMLIGLQMLTILRISDPHIILFSAFLLVLLVYFTAMWSQYATGQFKLGVVNPVDQGIPAYAIFAIANVFCDRDIFLRTGLLLPINMEVMICLVPVATSVIYFMGRNIFRDAIRDHRQIWSALWLPVTFFFSLLLLCLTDLERIYLPVFYCLMLSWSKNMIDIQVRYVTHQIYHPFSIATFGFVVPCALYALNTFITLITKDTVIGEGIWWAIALINTAIFLHFVFNICRQAKAVLGIQVFSIKQCESEREKKREDVCQCLCDRESQHPIESKSVCAAHTDPPPPLKED